MAGFCFSKVIQYLLPIKCPRLDLTKNNRSIFNITTTARASLNNSISSKMASIYACACAIRIRAGVACVGAYIIRAGVAYAGAYAICPEVSTPLEVIQGGAV